MNFMNHRDLVLQKPFGSYEYQFLSEFWISKFKQ